MSSDFCFQQYVYDENGKPKQLEDNKEDHCTLESRLSELRHDGIDPLKEDGLSLNILTRDEEFVLNKAQASDSSSVRCIHCAEHKRKQAIALAHEELSRGNTVVLQRHSDTAIPPEAAQINAELLRELTGYAMEGRGFLKLEL